MQNGSSRELLYTLRLHSESFNGNKNDALVIEMAILQVQRWTFEHLIPIYVGKLTWITFPSI